MAAGGGKEMEIAIKIAGKVESSFKSVKTVGSAVAALSAS